MTGRLRQGLAASAVVLAILATAWSRLDVAAMQASMRSSLTSQLGLQVQIGVQRLSLFPFVGARLEQVDIRQRGWQVSAETVFVHVRLLPLLLGKAEVDKVEFVSPRFRIQALGSLEAPMSQMAALPFGRLLVQHGSLQLADTPPFLEDFQLDVRDIGANRDVMWEMQAMVDSHLLRSHGRLSMRNGELHDGFGKLKLEQVPLTRFRSFLSEAWTPYLLPSMTVSASGTWELTRNRVWSLFGDVRLAESGRELGYARGKLQRAEDGSLAWRDSFLHLGEQSVVAVSGSCDGDGCKSRLKGSNLPLDYLRPFWVEGLRRPDTWAGTLGIDLTASWQRDVWQMQGEANLSRSDMKFGADSFTLPAARLQIGKLSGTGRLWALEQAQLKAGKAGALDVHAALHGGDAFDAEISTGELVDAWRPMGNVLLASFRQPTQLRGEGSLSGRMWMQGRGDALRLGMQGNLRRVHLAFTDGFDKPAGVDATGSLTLVVKGQQLQRAEMDDVRLASSSVKHAAWEMGAVRQLWKVEGAQLDLDQVSAVGVRLPRQLQGLTGKASADLVAELEPAPNGRDWLPVSAHGQLALQSFGFPDWRWSGLLKARGADLQASRLHVEGGHGHADLTGRWRFPATIHADVLAGDLDWERQAPMPAFMSLLELDGRISQASVGLLGNAWKSLQCSYRWQGDALSLSHLKTSLAGGEVASTSMVLRPGEGKLGVLGDLQLKDLHLDQLHGLQELAAAELKGRLYANLKVDGTLPATGLQGWRADGDMVVYDGYRLPKAEAGVATAVGTVPAWAKLYAFRQLGAHVDLKGESFRLSRIALQQMGDSYAGEAEVAASGAISGSMRDARTGEDYRLSGDWPRIIWEKTAPRR